MAKHKYATDGLWSIKWLGWTMVDEMNEIDHGRWKELDGLWCVNTGVMEISGK